MDNIVEEKTSSSAGGCSGFPEDFEALFKLLDEWKLRIECLKKYATEKTNEEKKHAAERFEKASVVFDKVSVHGYDFLSDVCEREKKFAKNRCNSLNSDQLMQEIKEINAGFEKLCASSKEKYRQSSCHLKTASDAVQKSKSNFLQKNIEFRKSKLSRTTSENGELEPQQDGNLTLKQNKLHKKLKDSEKEWESRVDEANAKDKELERLKDEIVGKMCEHVEKSEKAINKVLETLLVCLNCSQKPLAGIGNFEIGKSNLLSRLEKFQTRERSNEPRFIFNPVEEITRTFSPPLLRKNQRKSSEPILDSMKSDWLTKNRRGSEGFRNSVIVFSNLDGDTKIKLIKMGLTHVDNQGLDCKGIYRKSGSEARFKTLSEKMLETDGDDCDEIFPETDIYTIARYTKNLLINANELLFTKKVKQEIIRIFKRIPGDVITESVLAELKTCLKKLPPKNAALLMMVFQHLNKVATKSEINSMTASNLALIFSPALFNYCSEGTYNSQHKTWPRVTEVFINDYRVLFDLDLSSDQIKDHITKENNNKVVTTRTDDVFRENSPLSQNLPQIPEQND